MSSAATHIENDGSPVSQPPEPPQPPSMKLYVKVDRIHAELRALGFTDKSPLTVADLMPFDNYNYLQCDDFLFAALKLTSNSRVLEIGSGIGGPARYIADRSGCRVTALELQHDLNDTAVGLTARCSATLKGEVEHVRENIMDGGRRGRDHDAIVSILCFLHIPNRERLFLECRYALTEEPRIAIDTTDTAVNSPRATPIKYRKSAGREGQRMMYIDDYVKLREPTESQWANLRTRVQCSYLPTMGEYRAQLEAAGFEIVEMKDLTVPWAEFVRERLSKFRTRRARHTELHGAEITRDLEDFYAFVSEIFAEGIIGGVRIVATLLLEED